MIQKNQLRNAQSQLNLQCKLNKGQECRMEQQSAQNEELINITLYSED
jgi:hypothetical protein